MAYVPLIGLGSLAIYSYVFVLNRGSNVAQLSQSHDLWALWFECWIPLSVLTIIAVLSSAIFELVAIIKKGGRKKIVSGAALLFQSVVSLFFVVGSMPDA